MAKVTLTVNDRSFDLACADGDEGRLQKLAAYVDERVRMIADSGAVRKESDLMALTAIVLADELFEAQNDNPQSSEDYSEKLKAELDKQEGEYAAQVDKLTETVQKLAETLK